MRADLKIGICGEHGGEPSSVAFCDQLGLDYVSCSPYRVPIARLAAAQATLGTLLSNSRRIFLDDLGADAARLAHVGADRARTKSLRQ